MSNLRVGIVVFPRAEELDWAGPYEVFGVAAMHEAMSVVTIAQTSEPVTGAKGLRVIPDHHFGDAPALDVLVVPGGIGVRAELKNPVFLQWLASAAAPCRWVTSVCTGAALLSRAGLTKGKRITTHWSYLETLGELAPDSEVIEDVRFVADGHVVTAAGVSAGIDMSLWLVGELFGAERARWTRRWMQYDPEPPY